jgi:hypothetical protein
LSQFIYRTIFIFFEADKPDPARAHSSTGIGHLFLYPRIAKDTLLALEDFKVKKGFLIGTSFIAVTVSLTPLLVLQNNTILWPFIESIPGTGFYTSWFTAMVTYTREIKIITIRIFSCTLVFFPVGTPIWISTYRLKIRLGIFSLEKYFFIIELPRFPIVNFRRMDPFKRYPISIATPQFFPISGVAPARHGHHIIPIHIGHTFSLSPEPLAANSASMTPNAFIKVDDHSQLPLGFHQV